MTCVQQPREFARCGRIVVARRREALHSSRHRIVQRRDGPGLQRPEGGGERRTQGCGSGETRPCTVLAHRPVAESTLRCCGRYDHARLRTRYTRAAASPTTSAASASLGWAAQSRSSGRRRGRCANIALATPQHCCCRVVTSSTGRALSGGSGRTTRARSAEALSFRQRGRRLLSPIPRPSFCNRTSGDQCDRVGGRRRSRARCPKLKTNFGAQHQREQTNASGAHSSTAVGRLRNS